MGGNVLWCPCCRSQVFEEHDLENIKTDQYACNKCGTVMKIVQWGQSP